MLHIFCPFNCSRFGLAASLLPGPPPFWGKLDLTMSGGLRVLEGKEFGLRSTRRGRMEEEESREPNSRFICRQDLM